ncbi:MAG TPA: BTAD domain-containing putative transcriptional regulator [Terriglobales bacterium]|nr:BTAD domain-containing putative transcriptional regulator [Terriglobales bacterium]
MGVRVYVAGRLCLESGGRLLLETQLGSRQGRTALAYLVCERHRSVPREELAEVVWEDGPPPAWDVDLRALVSRLRSAATRIGLDGSALFTSGLGCYHFRLPAGGWVDIEAAADGIHRAETLLRSGRARDACGWALVARMNARRPFLPGHDAAWAERRRSQLRDIHVRALDALAEVWIGSGDPLLAARDAEESIAIEPYREVGYQWLMRAQAAASNRGEAVRAFRRCQETLARDLGVEPSPVTEAVFYEVLYGARPATALQRRSANVGGHVHRIRPMEVDDGPDSDV